MLSLIQRTSIFLVFILMANCASLNESLRARKLLGNCKYELKEIRLKNFDFSPIISFRDGQTKINIEEVKVPQILLLLEDIRKGDFSFSLKELKFDALAEIDNPNSEEVILDSLGLKLFLDNSHLLNLAHQKNLRIAEKSKAISTIACKLPLDFPLDKLLNAKEFSLDGEAFMKVDFSKKISKEIKLPIKVTREIPREEINAAIAKEKERILKVLIDKTKRNPKVQKLKDALKIKGF